MTGGEPETTTRGTRAIDDTHNKCTHTLIGSATNYGLTFIVFFYQIGLVVGAKPNNHQPTTRMAFMCCYVRPQLMG